MDLPPEKDAGLAASYDTPAGKVAWKDAQAEPNGYVDLC
jgi:hypothetical protein